MKLMLGSFVIILLPMVAIFLLTSGNISRLSRGNFTQAATGELRQASNVVATFLGQARLNIAMTAALPVNKRIEELKTTFVGTSDATLAKVWPDDEAGRLMFEAFAPLRESHPDYLAIYIGNRDGKYIINHKDPDKKQPAGFDPRKRPWWKTATDSPREAVVTPAYEAVDKIPMISVCKAVLDAKGDILGVAAMDITLTQITDLIKKIRIGRTGYVILVQDDGVIISDPRNPANNFKKVGETGNDSLAAFFTSGAATGTVSADGKAFSAAAYTSPELKWRFIGLIEENELMEPVSAAVTPIAAVALASMAAMGLGIWFLARRIVIRPLNRVNAFLGDISRGSYGRIEHRSSDEIGSIFDSLNSMSATLKDNIAEIEARTADAQEKARAAELATREAETAKLQAERARAEGMLHAAHRLEEVVHELSGAVSALSGHSEDIRQGTDVQRDRLNSTATAMEEMNSTVLEVAKNASNAALQGKDARDKAS
jgi:methyl-accepting chemotaxis protein